MINIPTTPTPGSPSVAFPPIAPPVDARSSETTAAEPQDSVSLSRDALAYVDPDEVGTRMGDMGKVVGAAAGATIGVAAPAAMGQPAAGAFLGPIGLGVGNFVGQGAGYVVGAAGAHMCNAAESVVRGVGSALEAGGDAISGAYRWVTGR